jgi:DMSO/TMAO reductase YedYZ heme-binding membrane subunit
MVQIDEQALSVMLLVAILVTLVSSVLNWVSVTEIRRELDVYTTIRNAVRGPKE